MTREQRCALYRQGLHPLYAPLFDVLGVRLGDDWAPTCGLRSFDEQQAKYDQGRTQPGPIVTNAPPGLSLHQYGLASDWDYFPGNKYTPLSATDPKWSIYIEAVEKLGLRMVSWEKPHNEYACKHSVHELKLAYEQGGMDKVGELLQT